MHEHRGHRSHETNPQVSLSTPKLIMKVQMGNTSSRGILVDLVLTNYHYLSLFGQKFKNVFNVENLTLFYQSQGCFIEVKFMNSPKIG